MESWNKIDQALNSELENFDEFMTARKIDGEKTGKFSEKELSKIEKILEKPLPERFVQKKLLDQHIKHSS